MPSPASQSLGSALSRKSVTEFHSGAAHLELALEVVTHKRDFQNLRFEWAALFDTCSATATLFQSFEWAETCFERTCGTAQICILTARQSGRLVAIAPLMLDRNLGLPTLRWIGGSLAIYGDVLAARTVDVGQWLSSAFEDIARRRIASSVLLENVRSEALAAPFLREAARPFGRQAAPVLDMDRAGSFERWQESLSKSTRRGRKRRYRNLEAAGHVRFDFEMGGPHVRGHIRELFRLKRAWAASRAVVSRTIGDPEFEALVSAIVTGGFAANSRISTLRLNGEPIAMELGFVTGDRYLSYLGAYDPGYQEYSPGSLQIEHTIAACFSEWLGTFDLLPPNDDYKAQWANATMSVATYAVPLTSTGVIQGELLRFDAVGRAKACVKRVPPPMKHAIYALFRAPPTLASIKAAISRTVLNRPQDWSILALAVAAGAVIAAD